jgi:hypothetical protein
MFSTREQLSTALVFILKPTFKVHFKTSRDTLLASQINQSCFKGSEFAVEIKARDAFVCEISALSDNGEVREL